MTGNVFHYTAKGTIASYEKTNDGYETLVREVLSGLNDTIDYTDYDSDGDGYIDALCLSVPSTRPCGRIKAWAVGQTDDYP